MNATLRSSLCAAVLLALVVPAGCIESRPHRGRQRAEKAAAAPVVRTDPNAVDGSLDRIVTGERMRVDYDADDAMTGATTPLVTIVEFSDFECPFCGRLAEQLSGVLARYPDDVRLVFKQFPLAMHAHAEPAARAAVAAGAQGKFWEMHDRLFADRSKLGDDDLLAHAEAIGLDRTAFATALAAPATGARVREQMQEGSVLELSSTPTFFVNGRKFSGAKDAETIAQIVDEEIVVARALMAAGAKREDLYAHFMRAATPGAGTPPKLDPEHKRGEASAQANYAVPVGADRPSVGPDDAAVTLIAYIDYGTEPGDAAFPTLRAVKQKHPEIRIAFRFLPGTRETIAAAKSLIAAGRQDKDKTWALHERFVAAGKGIAGAPLRRHAREVELDLERFDRDVEDPAVAAMLEEDRAVIETVRGTAPPPFFLINGRFVGHDTTVEQIDALIAEEATKAAAFAKAEGVAAAELYEAMRKSWRGYRIIEGVAKAPRMAAGAPTAGNAAAAAAEGAIADTPVLGDPAKAKVTIVACTDFDCPACARGAKVLQTLRERYGDALAIQFRHNAPGGRHTADAAHLAAIAAARQDKFWQLHDLLYANKSARSEAALAKLAAQADIELEAWNLARTDEALRARIQEDTAACASLGLAALPSYAVAGTTIKGAQPIDRFTAVIDAALTK
ncbi:MAG: thioredoxin domain-containing protein [Deltaproteobacteria bacterium]|nr:thioredoxin domain-containing protein [Deltaproteobacteria bacterium]MBK8719155.1 thioredoxin domain-containing protein [Deltaproteobacteria bacterium]MBP7289804.1 thioredoxin domain-containing protein [Nannocystaceae bacterium]